ncbi:hypothetical protein P3G55_01485 [Leptospira sp. 96542]|nr:hypothetical protein [Leptospira sp. 96542]
MFIKITRIVFVISSVLIFNFCESSNQVKPLPPKPNADKTSESEPSFPKNVEEYLGKSTLNSIGVATSVEFVKIASQKSDSQNQFLGYPIVAQGKEVSKSQVESFKKILLDNKTYLFATAKKVMFLPKYGVKLGETLILIDAKNSMLSLPLDGNSRIEDFDPAKKQIFQILKQSFPEDTF